MDKKKDMDKEDKDKDKARRRPRESSIGSCGGLCLAGSPTMGGGQLQYIGATLD